MRIKLIILLVISTVIQVNAAVHAQQLTLHKSGISLKQVFREIKLQTGYDVFYKSGTLNASQKIDAAFSNSPLNDVMAACLRDQHLDFVVYENTIVVKEKKQAVPDKPVDVPPTRITGTVTDTKDVPLPGVTVRVKGAAVSTGTDADGRFSINLPADTGTLIFSYMGFTTREMKVSAANASIIVKLEEALTRIQDKKIRAIELKNRLTDEEKRLRIETMEFELQMLRGGGKEDFEDDGFMDALKGVASGVWADDGKAKA